MHDSNALTAQQRFEHYLVIKRQIATLTRQADALKSGIKTDLENGAALSDGREEAVLRYSYTTSYPVDAFRAVFGDEHLTECVSIDNKKVARLVEEGVLDPARVVEIALVSPRPAALYIQPVAVSPAAYDDGGLVTPFSAPL